MSPLRKVTRQAWIDAASGFVGEGENLAEVSFGRLGARVGATKGSFYANFPGKLAELHAEVIARWQGERIPPALADSLEAVRDPLDRLRMLRAASAAGARRDDAMRRWAATEPDAAAALAETDHQIAGYVRSALRDLGYPGAEADVLAAVVAPVLPAAGQGDFETLLAVLVRAAVTAGGASAGRPADETGLARGAVPDEAVIYSIASTLPPDARAQLRADAQRFAATIGRAPASGRRTADGDTVA